MEAIVYDMLQGLDTTLVPATGQKVRHCGNLEKIDRKLRNTTYQCKQRLQLPFPQPVT